MRAAANLFQSAGYQNVSIEEIGAAVGLTGPAVYRHFKGKHDILVQALMGQVDVVEEIARRAAQDGGDPGQRMGTYLAELVELGVHRDEAMLWRRERRHLEAAEQEAFRKQFGTVLMYTETALAAVRPELNPGQLELLSLALLSLFGYTRDIRAGLDDARLAALQDAMGWAIVRCALPAGQQEGGAAPIVERRPAGRRERVIAAAAELFDARGFYDVRVDDIARAAGISVTTLYQPFPTKTQILHAILERGLEGLMYVTAEALVPASTPDEVLDVLIRSYAEQVLGLHGRTMRILATDAHYLSADVQRALSDLQDEYIAEWIAAIRALRPDLGQIDARAAALSVVGVITDLSQTARIRSRPGIHGELRALVRAILLPGHAAH